MNKKHPEVGKTLFSGYDGYVTEVIGDDEKVIKIEKFS